MHIASSREIDSPDHLSAARTLITMASSERSETNRTDSPDPASHATNIYDAPVTEGEWEDETDDDDIDFEPTTDESEEVEFFDPNEDPEAGFHGLLFLVLSTCLNWMLSEGGSTSIYS